MKSTDDERIDNNVMRHEYRILTKDEKIRMQTIKDHAKQLHDYLENTGSSRELSLAKTKLQESVFWAVNHVTK